MRIVCANYRIFINWVVTITIFFSFLTPVRAQELEKVAIQLKWFHQFQFAGYYAAKEKGFFKEEGLVVTILERNPQKNNIQSVLDGDADYGVADAGLVLERMKGKPVVLLKQIFQHSPLVLITRQSSGITNPFMLRGKRVMANFSSQGDAPLIAMFIDTLGGIDNLQKVDHTFRLDELINGTVEAMVAYITNEPYLLKKNGIRINIINPNNYGIDFYGDNLFTTEQEIKKHPKRVKSMMRATLRGWQYALDHPEEIIQLILKEYNCPKKQPHLEYEAQMTKKMIASDESPIGTVLTSRFEDNIQNYIQAGLVDKEGDWSGFIYQKNTIPLWRAEAAISLSPKEKKWLEENPVITVHNEEEGVPFNFNENGTPKGFSIDYMNLIAEKAGLKVKHKTGSWNELFEMTKNNRLDVMLNIAKSVEREKTLYFSEPYYELLISLFVRDDVEKIKTIQDLYGKRVAVPKGSYVEDLIKKHPEIKVVSVKNTRDAVIAVSLGNAEALYNIVTAVNYLIRELSIDNIRLEGEVGFSDGKPMSLHIAVNKDKKILASIINKAMASIGEDEIEQLRNKWMGLGREKSVSQIQLTAEEKKFLKNHPLIKVSNEMDYPPFDFAVGGVPKGYSIDLLNLMAQKIGIKIEYVNGYTWTELVDQFKKSKLDLIHSLSVTPDRLEYGIFSTDYIRAKRHFVTLAETPDITEFSQLYGKTAAAVKGWKQENYFETQHPQINLILVENMEQLLESVSNGDAYAVIGNVIVLNYMIKKMGMLDLKVSGWAREFDENKSHKYHFMAQKDAPELISMLNKAFDLITIKEKSQLDEKWLGSPVKKMPKIPLTPQEKRFIKEHTEIVLGSTTDFAPYTLIDEKGGVAGLVADFVTLINQRSGLNIRIETGNWANVEQKAVKGEIDGLMPVFLKEAKRTDQFNLTREIATEHAFVLVKIGNPENIYSINDLRTKKIAVHRGGLCVENLAKTIEGVEIVYTDTASEMIKKVISGEVDFAICMRNTLYIARQEGLANFIEIAFPIGEPQRVGIGVRKDSPELFSIINKSIQSLSEIEKNEIRSRWLLSLESGTVNRYKIGLSPEEQLYLKQKGTLKMCVLPDWLPYDRINKKGEHEGIGAEMIQLIAQRINTPIELVPTKEWGESLKNIRDRVCDILPISMNVPSRRASMNFTRPYIVEPFVIATRRDELFVKDAKQIGHRKVGVVKNSAFYEVLKSRYPDMQIMNVKNSMEGLRRVQKGALFGYIDSMPTIGYNMQESSMLDLKIAGKLEFDLEISIASRNDEPLLTSIMQKAADSITEEERRQIIGRWLSIRFEQGFNYSLFWKVLIVVALMFAAVLFWVRRLAVLNRKIRQANLKAEEANRAKSEFLANMSHEIRTPLNAVTGFSELLSSLVTDEKQKSYLEAIKSSGKNLMLLINDILDLSKIEAGKLAMHYSTVDLRGLLQEVKQMFALQVSKKDIEFVIDISDELPAALQIDEIRLRQVLLNIVGNAVKFTETGRIKLSVKAIQTTDLAVFDIHISVEDTGIGIAEKEIETIFDSFRQQAGQDSSLYGGTGLGLAICRRLIEMMNGQVLVESVVGKGSVFEIILKDVAAKHKVSHIIEETFNHENSQFEKGKILVVDDVESNRHFLKELLNKVNLEVLEAQNGFEAIVISPEYQPDMILMDIRMSVMDGLEAATQLKNNQKTRHIPIIAVTASSLTTKQTKILKKRFNGFLSKPVEIDKLLVELSKYLSIAKTDNKEVILEKKESADISKLLSVGALSGLQELIPILESDFRNQWKRFKIRQPMKDVKQFGNDLKVLGLKFDIDYLAAYGESLIIHVDNFDISSMQEVIDEFPVVLSELKKMKEENI